jgi:hypothetical protein
MTGALRPPWTRRVPDRVRRRGEQIKLDQSCPSAPQLLNARTRALACDGTQQPTKHMCMASGDRLAVLPCPPLRALDELLLLLLGSDCGGD